MTKCTYRSSNATVYFLYHATDNYKSTHNENGKRLTPSNLDYVDNDYGADIPPAVLSNKVSLLPL